MEWILKGLGGFILSLLIALLYVAITDDSPSCEDRGGKTASTHYMPIFNGKTTVLIPQYKCQMPAP